MKKSVTIELDKARNLRYGINALCTIEEIINKPITTLDLNNLSMKELRAILYAGLVHEDKSLTEESVGSLIDDYTNISDISTKLGSLFCLANASVCQATNNNSSTLLLLFVKAFSHIRLIS